MNSGVYDIISLGCVGPQTSAQYWGPTGHEGQTTDPYVLCKYFQEKAFSAGELVIRPMEEKPTQTVSESTMVSTFDDTMLS